MELDPLLLSRIQFGLTIGFHFIFPPLSIGLAWLLVVVEGLGWRRGDEKYIRAGKFFGKILGLTFVLGVATGIVMEFQFGTNWAEYSKFVGDIFGAPLAAEAIFAFFIESTFLALYLFGRERVSAGVHWFSILMVSIGATISAFWILIANSWQQTPAGYVVKNGRAELTDFHAAVFNASMWYRFFHMMNACLICGGLLMAGVSAYLVLRNRDKAAAAKTLRLGLVVGALASIMALFPTGHQHARQVARTQPEKLAAFEGLIHTTKQAPLLVFGIPSENPPRIDYAVELPGMLSFLIFDDINASVEGIENLREDGHPTPPLVPVFISFHLMVGLGTLFILLNLYGIWLLARGRLEKSPRYLRLLPWAIPLPLAACQLGWLVAEVGRQPWVVYRLLKTADAYSTNVSGAEILFSTIAFSLIYAVLGALYLFLLLKMVKQGPDNA
ncbi:MAG: cytochrome ubiquinol oxidase subunit I [Planctomycetota bacterium]|nr:cytochrome ubiquinol oxidase subunit I [Planctomycetota bacterium]